jgi:hypothetical protein
MQNVPVSWDTLPFSRFSLARAIANHHREIQGSATAHEAFTFFITNHDSPFFEQEWARFYAGYSAYLQQWKAMLSDIERFIIWAQSYYRQKTLKQEAEADRKARISQIVSLSEE